MMKLLVLLCGSICVTSCQVEPRVPMTHDQCIIEGLAEMYGGYDVQQDIQDSHPECDKPEIYARLARIGLKGKGE